MRISDQEANRLKVLKAIRRAEPVARTELVRLTGLASGSITEIVGDLVRRKALLEAKSPAVGRGRPRVQLYLNPEAGLVCGAFLLPSGGLSIEICNTRGDRLWERTTTMPRAPSVHAWAEQIGEAIDAAIEASPLPRLGIRRVGLALPAVVDSVGGVVHWLQTYPLESVEVGAIVERRVGLPVTVDNSANVIARAEHWFGEDRQVDDFSMLVVGLGMGFSEYVDGMLKTGAHGINSEFAHAKIALGDALPCTCGAMGCLAAHATGYGVVLRARAARGLPRPRLRHVEAAYRECVEEARAGDPAAVAAFEQAGHALGLAVANLINMSDPARVLVLALDQAFADRVAAAFHAALQENTLPALRGRTPVQLRVAEEARYSHGAAALVLEHLYRAATRPQAAVPAEV